MLTQVRADITRLTRSERSPLAKYGVVLCNLGLHAVVLYRVSPLVVAPSLGTPRLDRELWACPAHGGQHFATGDHWGGLGAVSSAGHGDRRDRSNWPARAPKS
jgi:hypothetical protein